MTAALAALLPWAAAAQIPRPPALPPPKPSVPPAKGKAAGPERTARTPTLAADEVLLSALTQEADWPWRRLRGSARVETVEMLLQADEIDYNAETEYAEARGNVRFRRYSSGEELEADRVEYNLREETGKYYNVRGKATPKPVVRQGVLPSANPFLFQGRWAERLKDRYILHHGFVTNCKLPRPTWTLRGSRFDIIPNDRAIAHNAVFRLLRVPLLYTPIFYKSLESLPRRSGFLTPNAGNSSRRGKMVGVGYYWAINRSYDAAYRAQYFTQRGVAHHLDVRGKPRAGWDFNAVLYGVNDRGLKLDNGERRKEGGFLFSVDGSAILPRGFYARGEVNYLSSFAFRQSFTESFYEAIFSEVHSTGFIARQWSSYDLNLVFVRNEVYQSTEPGDKIVVRKLPQLEFSMRDREVTRRVLPLWVSLDSAAGLVRRNQPLFQTRQYVERVDFAPRVTTALRWKGFHLLPSFAVRETYYGSTQQEGKVGGENLSRSAREVSLDLVAPPLARTFDSPSWLGEKLRHVIEPRASFRYVTGVADFNRLVRFDETELYSNTQEAEISLVNRIFAKQKDGQVFEVLSWQLWQRRYFDPTFGGAVVEGRRNLVESVAQLTGYSFLDGPRRYSPVVSVLRVAPRPSLGVEWRSDYDPARSKIVNSGLTADARFSQYFVSLGHNHVRSTTVLSPSANQLRGLLGVGKQNQAGWGAAFSAVYDFRVSVMQYATTQVSYNTDCCGFSVQYRRFSFGTRNENQFRLSLAIANIGSFGTLKKQERLF